jgi:hypothetical protein
MSVFSDWSFKQKNVDTETTFFRRNNIKKIPNLSSYPDQTLESTSFVTKSLNCDVDGSFFFVIAI